MTDHGRKPKRWASDLNAILAITHREKRFPVPVEELADMVGNNGKPMMLSQWKPSPQERADIAAGKDIWLWVIGTAHPPVMITVED